MNEGQPKSILPKPLHFLHPHLHFLGLVIIAIGLPFSEFLMSFGQFWIIGNWILEGRFTKFNLFLRNWDALLLSGIFLMLLPGLFYSENIPEGIKMMRINLPFFVLPFILSQRKPLSVFYYRLLLRLFMASVVLAAICCLIIGLPRWLSGEYADLRQMSIFISHIRFSLLISFVVLLIGWIFIYRPFRTSLLERVGWILSAIFLIAFLLILQALSGILVLIIIVAGWCIFLLWKKVSRKVAVAISISVLVFLSFSVYTLYDAYKEYSIPSAIYSSKLPVYTAKGNTYSHQFGVIENGHYIDAFVCEKELYESWNKRSRISLNGPDGKDQPLKSTLIRFLNSKGLRKDAGGIARLTDQEITFIENGIANEKYLGPFGIRMRFYQMLWELNAFSGENKDVSGHTVRMKLEFWKTSLSLISKNFIFGVGIGDVPDCFREEYRSQRSNLDQKWWLTSHNQYLYLMVASGLLGFMFFLMCFFLPFFQKPERRKYVPFSVFITIAAISMLTEDMLTTQAGVSFIAFFYALFLFVKPSEENS